MTDNTGFALPESVAGDDMVVATYIHRAAADVDIDERVRLIAEMQSTGTWVELELETDAIRERHGARVISLSEVPDDEAGWPRSAGTRSWVFRIAYPSHNIGGQIPLLLATVFGECASIGELRLLDIQLPESFVAGFKGPKFGIDGIRELVGVKDRPLLIAMMKPSIGLSPNESAEVFRQAALGGVDGVKDDELLVSHPWSNFVDRVRQHERAGQEAYEETGHRTLYFVNITDRPDRLVQNAYRAIEAGASALMVDHLTVGTAALSMLADDPAIAVPVMGHLAFSGAMTASPWTGVSSHLVLGKLPRLAGADVVVYPSPYGTLAFARSTHLRVARSMTDPLYGLRRILPAPGAGLHAGMAPRLVADLGIDWALGAGGAIHGHPNGIAAGARAIRHGLEAAARGVPLVSARTTSPDLDVALDRWPELDPVEPDNRPSPIEEGVTA
jgi:2,3-diketo-5-methylthiopentyl-1-phosphate enolase